MDFFKGFNDNYGYFVGDWCLKKIVDVMVKVVKRLMDLVVCYGGEEFVIIFFEISLEGVINVMEVF